jgi:hypothetical protein
MTEANDQEYRSAFERPAGGARVVHSLQHTPRAAPRLGVNKEELENRHVLFQRDDPDTCIEKKLDRTLLQESKSVPED